MDILQFNVIINEILKLTFPHITCNFVLFLTCKYFNNFQTKYYEYLRCSDKGSKNFMHMISIVGSTQYFFKNYNFLL